jgi:RNA polymerase sigma-70 factor (ECF subfamily)
MVVYAQTVKARSSEVRDEAARPPLTLEAIYRAHFAFVHRVAQRLAGPGIDAEDVAQEVFLVVDRRLDSYDRESRVTSWLYGITVNVVRAQRRRQRVRRLFELGLEPQAAAPLRSIDRAEVAEAHRIAYEILDRMSAKKREVFILAEFEELSCDEIAALVGAKTETVWSRLHYARDEFAARLRKRGRV